ncbi:uncharacterized protein LOC101855975 [Aplysia californica]|uniref:Uncharacterized protein LOC101855975 n=1 Tax=Aplysia californica TaxID=6500 RepID=A0ABM0K3M1_APLCA|nr:uncharacterized protein LOC101855975 [Aplysia californica]
MEVSSELRKSILKDLDERGFCVVPGVIEEADCDQILAKYKAWLSHFGEEDFPKNRRTVIHGYGACQMEPTWEIRLKAKPVFASVWGTEKLLSSMDGIGLQRPAQQKQDFDTGIFWFHCDQACTKVGVHSYQGALYLEATTQEDYCFRVIEGSHKKHQEFFPLFPKAMVKSEKKEFCMLTKEQTKWFYDNGCKVTNVEVPKGGMVLWDSRTMHDTKRPSKGLQNEERWRALAFVSMTPAAWATEADLKVKLEAYEGLEPTAHWGSRGVKILRFMGEAEHPGKDMSKLKLTQHPAVAKSPEVRRLVGIDRYDFDDGQPNGPDLPVYNAPSGIQISRKRKASFTQKSKGRKSKVARK